MSKQSFRARLHDPIGPRWTRLLLPLLALGTGILDYAWAALDDAAPGPAFYFAAILFMWSRPLLGRHRPRNCDVTTEPGRVTISNAGLLDQTIHTDDVVGASTSIAPDTGTSVAIARKGRGDHALHIEVDGAAQANKIREALGIGFGGYGTLRWKIRATRHETVLSWARVVGTICALVLANETLHDAPHSPPAIAFFVVALAWSILAPIVIGIGGGQQGLLWFNDFGVYYGSNGKQHHVAYADIASVEALKRALRIKLADGRIEKIPIVRARHSLLGVSQLEVEHIVAQIEDAARRARGEIQIDGSEPQVAGVEMLARSSADTTRAWLDRLDATAANMGGGYRAVNLTKDALVAALSDPDAAPDIRVGAARILYRIDADDAKTRVGEIAETLRDPHLRKRMRIVLAPDPNEAATELAEVDDDENLVYFR